ncbi:hypothetical protein C9374_003225 [Naegleria lovaniensis]|uniref:Poly A polymerase head domain-containing protein n=1 Tax=Naegleria lovaniensis TaxID=51637 RepID=A0AA88GUK0_NAELO|nr:uncharacterized protein C9374_003225 [Naegleria lovaniensis]KAG2386076.1 hypothetical protein C9374_003225 [Naegleria lovaniensis]
MLPSTSCSPVFTMPPWCLDISYKKPCTIPNCPVNDFSDAHFYHYYHECPFGQQCEWFKLCCCSHDQNAKYHCNLFNHSLTGDEQLLLENSLEHNASSQIQDGRRMSLTSVGSACSSKSSSSRPKNVCWYGTKCRMAERRDQTHLSNYLHVCPNVQSCRNREPEHLQQFLHKCHKGEKCTDKSQEHRDQYMHICSYGEKCNHLSDSSPDSHWGHFTRYLHPVCFEGKNCSQCKSQEVKSQGHRDFFCLLGHHDDDVSPTIQKKQPEIQGLTSKDKSNMRPHVTEWKRSASIPLTSPSGYKFIGWERATGNNTATGKVVLFKKTDKGVFEGHIKTEEVTNVSFPTNQIEQPWYRNRVCIYKNQLIVSVFKNALSGRLTGVTPSATYLDVMNYIVSCGVPVFIVGGAVRDVLYAVLKENETNVQTIISKVKDIDIGFGCPTQEFYNILCKKYSAGIQPPGPRGLIVVGNTNGNFLEGKALNGLNNDNKSVKDDIPQCFGTDLVGENICRDFTCNSLWYDPINECIIDPIGRGQGIKDTLNKVLRIPVKEKYRIFWAKGNPSKIMRYYKFLQKGYRPADDGTREFIIKMAKKFSATDMECRNQLVRGVMNSKTDAEAQQKKASFLKLLEKDVGTQRLKELFP